MSTLILEAKESIFEGYKGHYLTQDGYTRKRGCPTDFKVKVQGSNRWYRVYQYCISNSGIFFIKQKENPCNVICPYQLNYTLKRGQK